MSLSRRRFLTISAAALAAPSAAAAPLHWQGRALGAEVSITLHAPPEQARAALTAARAGIARAKALFSLFQPTSALSRLNAKGRLDAPPELADLLATCDRLHSLSEGRFDPTVQPLWRALAIGHDPDAARSKIGWHRVRREGSRITLAPGQALTLNGIAQGWATDRVRKALADHGLTKAVVNIGEHAALGGPFRLGLTDPAFGQMATRTLKNAAIATSSPAATPLGPTGHILSPDGTAPRWSTVSVEAANATLADGLSTALCLADRAAVRRIRARLPEVHRITLVDAAGDLETL